MPVYSEKVMEHFMNPRNVGEIENPDGVGEVGNPVCGDMMTFHIKVKDNRLEDIKFKTFGCGAAIAVSSFVIPVNEPRASSLELSWAPGPITESRYDAREMALITAGIRFAVDHGAHIVNLSLGFPPMDIFRFLGYTDSEIRDLFRPLRAAVNYAQQHGVILVAAAGNFDAPEVSLPAGYPGLISVGATDPDEQQEPSIDRRDLAACDVHARAGDALQDHAH